MNDVTMMRRGGGGGRGGGRDAEVAPNICSWIFEKGQVTAIECFRMFFFSNLASSITTSKEEGEETGVFIGGFSLSLLPNIERTTGLFYIIALTVAVDNVTRNTYKTRFTIVSIAVYFKKMAVFSFYP